MDDGSDRVERFDVASAFDRHRSALLGFAINAVRDRALAEDCVQEAFLHAWRARETFDADRGSERTWLFAIQRRVILDVVRAQSRTPRLAEARDVEVEPATERDPLERLGLIEALALLSDEHRAAVVAIHVDGRSYDELSASLGIPIPTLRTRTFYGLRALRALLDDKDHRDVR